MSARPAEYTLAGNLSGGNQQKVIVAREFSRPIKLIDWRRSPRAAWMWARPSSFTADWWRSGIAGCAVLLVSVELDEIMSLSDRIAVLYNGKIIDSMPADQATAQRTGGPADGRRGRG